MQATILSTFNDKIEGLQNKSSIQDDEVYIFKNVYAGTGFHMARVNFPIDIAFIDQDFAILGIETLEAQSGQTIAPEGTVLAVEASQGYFERNGLKVHDFWKEIYNRV